MSKIGRKAIQIPQGVAVTLDSSLVRISGPKGSTQIELPAQIKARLVGGSVLIERESEDKKAKALQGLVRQNILNAMIGQKEGWQKTLEIFGTGYRAQLAGNKLVLSIGFSHPVEIEPPSGISFSVNQNKITVSGTDKQLVGQIAQKIKKIRPPDVYKGKGIRYEGEILRKKPGKAAKVGGAATGGAK